MLVLMLISIFSIALLVRAYAAKYGFYLNEFDPYYDYYAANHIVTLAQQHGILYALFNNPPNCGPSVFTACHDQQGYFIWHDIKTWFPYGRNVASTSQDGLQLTGAFLYLLINGIFGVKITLYDFLVLLPVFLGAFSSILVYFLMRKIAGDIAGIFSGLAFAVSPPLIQRGNLGWFKSEPLAIFLFLSSAILFMNVFDKQRSVKTKLLFSLAAGLLAGYANTSWGGALYFSVAFGLTFIVIPFISGERTEVSIYALTFASSDIFVSSIFPRPGVSFVTNPAGLALIGGALFLGLANWSKTWSKAYTKAGMFRLLLLFFFAGLLIISFGLVGNLSLRYLSAIAPWARSGNPLVQSVAEQAVPTGADYFTSYLVLLFFSIGGAVVALRRRDLPVLFVLVVGLTGLYVSAAFSRLLVYSSISLCLMGGIGFAELAFALTKPNPPSIVKKKETYGVRSEIKVVYSIALIILITVPAGSFWIPNPIPCNGSNVFFCDQSPADSGVSLANGATVYSRSTSNDWTQALQWIRQNTPSNAVIISWWDYGYWITVMGNRTTVADNATLNGTRIAQIGRMFMSNVTVAAGMVKQMSEGRPAYVLIFIVGSVIPLPNGQQYYILQVPAGGGLTAGGGDESKKQWFIRIGGLNESQYLECPKVSPSCPNIDDFNLTPFALHNTIFGQMLPFKPAGYLVNMNNSINLFPNYTFGSGGAPPIQAFSYPYSFTYGKNSTGPFSIAYYSPSLSNPTPCASLTTGTVYCFTTILIYKVNYY
jgi:dolichyl-diphosphooligosaccharide--protein glycosyltransferase